jgi:hypothetical protein
VAAASALGVAGVVACEDAGPPGDTTVPTSDLVVLPLAASAPAPFPITFYAFNGKPTVQTIRHPDAFNTVYLEVRFPPGCLSSLNGTPLTVTDSLLVTVQPRADGYGFTLSPSGLVFTLGSTPSVTFSFARYADPSVADTIPSFADRQAYLAALDVWQEATVGRWRIARGSSQSGVDEIAAGIDAPGEFVLAAAR